MQFKIHCVYKGCENECTCPKRKDHYFLGLFKIKKSCKKYYDCEKES
jgi:hypothetical protein